MELIKELDINFLGISLLNWLILGGCFFGILLFSYLATNFKNIIRYIFFVFVGAVIFFLHIKYPVSFYPTLLMYLVLPAFLGGVIIALYYYEKPPNPIEDVIIESNKGNKIIRNVFRGIAIFGAAGSGKTFFVINSLLKHFAKNDFSGVVYDYKDGELTEFLLPLFKEKLKIISIHRLGGLRVNPIHPDYLKDEKDVIEIVKVVLDNLSSKDNRDNFFDETAESLLTAVVLRFSLDFPNYCNLPNVIAFLLAVDFSLKDEEKKKKLGEDAFDTFKGLKDFLVENKRVKIQASSFILGLASEKQTAGVISTLANSLRKVAFPDAFWALSGNELDFRINDEERGCVLSILNEPKSEGALTPLIATILHTITKQMMVRGGKQSFILLDEAPTIKFRNMARIVATMRSFQVCTVYCAQDVVQGIRQYTREGFKEILTNLSTQFFGKANDPDTAKFYEGYFEPVQIKTKSRTIKGSDDFFGDGQSTTVGEREVSKVRANEFMRFKVGEFAFLSDGKSEIISIKKPLPLIEKLPKEKEELKKLVLLNYENILEEMNNFAKSIGLSEK